MGLRDLRFDLIDPAYSSDPADALHERNVRTLSEWMEDAIVAELHMSGMHKTGGHEWRARVAHRHLPGTQEVHDIVIGGIVAGQMRIPKGLLSYDGGEDAYETWLRMSCDGCGSETEHSARMLESELVQQDRAAVRRAIERTVYELCFSFARRLEGTPHLRTCEDARAYRTVREVMTT